MKASEYSHNTHRTGYYPFLSSSLFIYSCGEGQTEQFAEVRSAPRCRVNCKDCETVKLPLFGSPRGSLLL